MVTYGAAFGTPNASIGVGLAMTQSKTGRSSIREIVGGAGSNYTFGLGPVGVGGAIFTMIEDK